MDKTINSTVDNVPIPIRIHIQKILNTFKTI